MLPFRELTKSRTTLLLMKKSSINKPFPIFTTAARSRPMTSFRSLASAFSLFPIPLPPPPNDAHRQLSSSASSSSRIVKCINCNYVTDDLHVLMDHLDTHYPVKTYLCIYCYQSFPGQLELSRHHQMRECPFMSGVVP